MESAFYIERDNCKLYSCLHMPENFNHRIGVILCGAFGEEYLWSYRVFVMFARFISRIGISVLRFDYMGSGDSDGNFADSDVESRLKDIGLAVKFMKSKDIRVIGLLGLRFGATMSLLWAKAHQLEVDFLVLWQPIFNLKQFMYDCLRSNLIVQMVNYGKIIRKREDMLASLNAGGNVNIDGYEISGKFFKEASEVDCINLRIICHPTLIVTTGNGNLGNDVITELRHNPDLNIQEITGLSFWKDEKKFHNCEMSFFKVTSEWLSNLRCNQQK